MILRITFAALASILVTVAHGKTEVGVDKSGHDVQRPPEEGLDVNCKETLCYKKCAMYGVSGTCTERGCRCLATGVDTTSAPAVRAPKPKLEGLRKRKCTDLKCWELCSKENPDVVAANCTTGGECLCQFAHADQQHHSGCTKEKCRQECAKQHPDFISATCTPDGSCACQYSRLDQQHHSRCTKERCRQECAKQHPDFISATCTPDGSCACQYSRLQPHSGCTKDKCRQECAKQHPDFISATCTPDGSCACQFSELPKTKSGRPINVTVAECKPRQCAQHCQDRKEPGKRVVKSECTTIGACRCVYAAGKGVTTSNPEYTDVESQDEECDQEKCHRDCKRKNPDAEGGKCLPWGNCHCYLRYKPKPVTKRAKQDDCCSKKCKRKLTKADRKRCKKVLKFCSCQRNFKTGVQNGCCKKFCAGKYDEIDSDACDLLIGNCICPRSPEYSDYTEETGEEYECTDEDCLEECSYQDPDVVNATCTKLGECDCKFGTKPLIPLTRDFRPGRCKYDDCWDYCSLRYTGQFKAECTHAGACRCKGARRPFVVPTTETTTTEEYSTEEPPDYGHAPWTPTPRPLLSGKCDWVECAKACRKQRKDFLDSRCTKRGHCHCKFPGEDIPISCTVAQCDRVCKAKVHGFISSSCTELNMCKCHYKEKCVEKSCNKHCLRSSPRRLLRSRCLDTYTCQCKYQAMF
ncbi:cell death abnormality protein 1-like isoform X2 [Ornithodoros turicata]|uniref:cell death abnormality protein 1-like isoform X2 n=1 Tax=Ornithodoros turicata TaxID=34597 RepID=UPI003138F8CE